MAVSSAAIALAVGVPILFILLVAGGYFLDWKLVHRRLPRAVHARHAEVHERPDLALESAAA
jgi:hypothetical protein